MDDLSKLIIEKTYKNSFILSNFSFWTPKLYIPFGLENKYNKYYLNLQIENKEFKEFIENIENKIIELLNISKDKLNSQLRNGDTTILYTKILDKNNKIITNVKTENNENINIFSLEKGSYCKAYLILDKVWLINDIYYYKYKIKTLILL